MRTIALSGLLVSALIPLTVDHHLPNDRETRALRASVGIELQQTVLTALFTAQRNREIDRSAQRVKIVRAQEFVAERNREIEMSIAAREAAEPLLFAEARLSEIEASSELSAEFAALEFTAQRNEEIEQSIELADSARLARFAEAASARSISRWPWQTQRGLRPSQ